MLFTKKRTFNGSMSFSVKVLRFLGYGWNGSGKNTLAKRIFLQIVCYILWLGPPALAYSVRHQQDQLKLVLKGFFEVMAVSGITFRLSLFARGSSVLRRVFDDVQEVLVILSDGCSSDVRKILDHLEISADKFAKGYTIVFTLQCLLYGPVQILLATMKYFKTGEMPTIAVIQADFILFDYNINFSTWFLVMFISVVFVNLGVLHTTTTETFYWNLIHHVSCLFKIIRIKISELDVAKDKKIFKQQLSFIVDMHEIAFKNCRRLETVLFVLLGYFYASCIAQICYLMFIFTIIRDDPSLLAMMGVAVQYNIFLIFAFSMLGTELIEASLSVADEVYKLRWYERSPEERRLLLSIQMRSQIEASMTAGKFFCVNRATFAMAMKTAFSYFTVIQQFYGQK